MFESEVYHRYDLCLYKAASKGKVVGDESCIVIYLETTRLPDQTMGKESHDE